MRKIEFKSHRTSMSRISLLKSISLILYALSGAFIVAGHSYLAPLALAVGPSEASQTIAPWLFVLGLPISIIFFKVGMIRLVFLLKSKSHLLKEGGDTFLALTLSSLCWFGVYTGSVTAGNGSEPWSTGVVFEAVFCFMSFSAAMVASSDS